MLATAAGISKSWCVISAAGSSLTIQDDLFQDTANPNAIGLLNQTSITADLAGNVLDSLTAGAFVQGPATETNNYDISGTLLPNATLAGVILNSTLIISDTEAHSVTLAGNVYGTDGDYLISGDSGNITYHGRQGQHCRGSAFQHHAARRRRPPHHQWWITRHRCWRLGRRRLQ